MGDATADGALSSRQQFSFSSSHHNLPTGGNDEKSHYALIGAPPPPPPVGAAPSDEAANLMARQHPFERDTNSSHVAEVPSSFAVHPSRSHYSHHPVAVGRPAIPPQQQSNQFRQAEAGQHYNLPPDVHGPPPLHHPPLPPRAAPPPAAWHQPYHSSECMALPPPPRDCHTRVKILKNDYNQHFVDTGERPQNFIRDAEPSDRFSEYPRLERLIQLKDEINSLRAHPPQHIKANLLSFDLLSLGCAFDVILVDPPWPEYEQRVIGGFATSEELAPWTAAEICKLRVDAIAETPSFCFIWAGENHLEDARRALQTWGFRRCEDLCWIKTNRKESKRKRAPGRHHAGKAVIHDETSIMQRTKEHCLMGIRGAVRRSTDRHFIHANVDTDVILDEEPEEVGSTAKPVELYDIIDRFCLGRRKLELFGRDRNIRKGWVTIGNSLSITNWDTAKYMSWTSDPPIPEAMIASGGLPRPDFFGYPEISDCRGGRYVGCTPEVEQLRPKSPPRPGPSSSSAPSQSSAAAVRHTSPSPFAQGLQHFRHHAAAPPDPPPPEEGSSRSRSSSAVTTRHNPPSRRPPDFGGGRQFDDQPEERDGSVPSSVSSASFVSSRLQPPPPPPPHHNHSAAPFA